MSDVAIRFRGEAGKSSWRYYRAIARTIDRRTFLAATSSLLACDGSARGRRATSSTWAKSVLGSDATSAGSAETRSRPASSTTASLPSGENYALFERFPGLASGVSRLPLARLPSRVEAASRLASEIGLGDAFYVKRDDDIANAVGGGKVRKLELFFGEARRLGRNSIATVGGVGSNQAVATALLGRELGFSVTLGLAPQPWSALVTTNLQADAASGARMALFSSVSLAQATLRELTGPSNVFVIPAGGTSPLGTLAFVNAGLEIAADVARGLLPAPRRIYVALGLGGTATGIAIGCALASLETEVVAVRASNPATVSGATIARIADETIAHARHLDASFPTLSASSLRIRIDGRFVGSGYGSPTPEGDMAVRRAREAEGWELDPVYTGKALAAVVEDAKAGVRGPVLFWNTQSSRPLPSASVPEAFRRFVRKKSA